MDREIQKAIVEQRDLRRKKLEAEEDVVIKALTKLGEQGGDAFAILDAACQAQTVERRDWIGAVLRRLTRHDRIETWVVDRVPRKRRRQRWYRMVDS